MDGAGREIETSLDVPFTRFAVGLRPSPDFANPGSHVDVVRHDAGDPRVLQEFLGNWTRIRVAGKPFDESKLVLSFNAERQKLEGTLTRL